MEGDERLRVSSRTQRWIAAPAVIRSTGHGEVVFAVQGEAGCRETGTAGTGESGGAHVHIGQAASGALHDDLSVHCFSTCAGQADGRSRAGGVGLSNSDQTR